MADRIRHSGIVERVNGDTVSVRILQTSACASCEAAKRCNASGNKVKTVDVRCCNNDASRWHVGDAVMVSASITVAAKALVFSFGVPFLIMVVVLVLAMAATDDETIGGVAALASLLPYYCALYLLRERISGSVSFSIDD